METWGGGRKEGRKTIPERKVRKKPCRLFVEAVADNECADRLRVGILSDKEVDEAHRGGGLE